EEITCIARVDPIEILFSAVPAVVAATAVAATAAGAAKQQGPGRTNPRSRALRWPPRPVDQ
ncbi:MAG TPA: hypothetical protein PKC36_00205, partial [Dietzia sp.]|nr:hypothetical protein [Dietzia sp.]